MKRLVVTKSFATDSNMALTLITVKYVVAIEFFSTTLNVAEYLLAIE
jgi:hypothetical protein